MLHAKENSYYPLSTFCITNKLPTIIYIRRLDSNSSNKVDSVNCIAVECPSLRVRDRHNTFFETKENICYTQERKQYP